MQSLRKLLRRVRYPAAEFDLDRVPSVAFLLQHRLDRQGQPAISRGDTPTASLYRMYEYFVIGFTNGLRTEIEYFFNKPWPVAEIPDPRDPDPQRYAILAILPFYLTVAYNRLIEMGLPRGAPAVIDPEMEDELKSRPKVLEKQPHWVTTVPRLEETLVIPDGRDMSPESDTLSSQFQAMNIVAQEPHVLFV